MRDVSSSDSVIVCVVKTMLDFISPSRGFRTIFGAQELHNLHLGHMSSMGSTKTSTLHGTTMIAPCHQGFASVAQTQRFGSHVLRPWTENE